MEVNIGVYGMTCSHCQKRVEDAVSLLEGVESVRVNLEAERANVSFNPQKISMDDIKEAIGKAG
jgi:Cu+-exporting ATPase